MTDAEMAPSASSTSADDQRWDERPHAEFATRAAVAAGGLAALLLVGALGLQMIREGRGLPAGAPAPPFALTTFEGTPLRLESLQGMPVVLNFFASWCVSCVNEATELEDIWREYSERGVVVIGVAYNDTRAAARSYVERHGITYPSGMDAGGRISADYRLTGVPETVVIDQAGMVVALHPADGTDPVSKIVGPVVSGGAFTPGDLRGVLERLLDGGGG